MSRHADAPAKFSAHPILQGGPYNLLRGEADNEAECAEVSLPCPHGSVGLTGRRLAESTVVMTMRSTLPHVARFALLLGAASCTGPSYDNTAPFVGDTPEVYVAKVKNILVGLPPTFEELKRRRRSPRR